MSRIRWEGDIENRRSQLRENGITYNEIANILSEEFGLKITKDMVSSRDRIVRMKSIRYNNCDEIDINTLDGICAKDEYNFYEKDIPLTGLMYEQKLFPENMYDIQKQFIASENTKAEMKKIWELFEDGQPKKMLVLSDLHAPYMNFTKIEQAIKDNEDCDICILNGDIFDGESMSVFDKMEEIDSSEEFDQVFKLLDVLTVKFKYIIWVGGNHDFQRFCKYIIKNIKPGLRKFAFDRLNPIKFISDKYQNVISINHNTLQIGDVVFKHPNGYSGVEMKTVVNEMDIMTANRYDLPNPNFRCICIGHTHDGGEYYRNGVKLMETCCLCYTPDYRFNNPVKRKWVNGYARIELDECNKIIFNKSHVFCLDD